jgi:Tfp pilus assembly protein PilN
MLNSVNLIPATHRDAQRRRRRIHRWIVAGIGWCAMLVAACATTQIVWSHPAVASVATLDGMRARAAEINAALAKLKIEQAEIDRVKLTAATMKDQPDWSILLAMISHSVGEDVILRDIELLPDPKIQNQSTLRLRGIAPSGTGVSQYVLRLQNTQIFDEVKLVRTEREPILETSASSFEIACIVTDENRRPQ